MRAAQEGIVFSFKYGIDIMEGMGIPVQKIHAGHANMFLSSIFRDTLAGVTGAVIELYDTDGSVAVSYTHLTLPTNREEVSVQVSIKIITKHSQRWKNWMLSSLIRLSARNMQMLMHAGNIVWKNQWQNNANLTLL